MGVPISNVTRRVVYAASGTGPYNFTFEILAAGDVAVYKDDTLLTITTDYTVTINTNGTGYITLTASPTGATQIAIVGNRTIQRTTDFVTGGDFFANTVNDEMDQQTIFAQQNAEGLQRALQAPQTDPTSINMTLPRASVRASKVLSFDASGNPSATEFIGSNRGNWASGTLYYVRDIVKDTSTSNIWQCLVQHTSSGSQPLSTNTDSAKWFLLVDAASAGASATAAAASASAAATSASNASTSASNAASSASTASTQASNAATSATNAANSATASANSATAAAASAAAAAASFDAFDDIYLGAKSSDPSVDNDGNALTTGDQYFNTVANELRVYNGSTWQAASTVGGTVTSLNVTGATTLAQNPTLSAGTANGVAYLNGSKVLTTGSALTFDGTNLGLKNTASLADNYNTLEFSSDFTPSASVDTNESGRVNFYNKSNNGTQQLGTSIQASAVATTASPTAVLGKLKLHAYFNSSGTIQETSYLELFANSTSSLLGNGGLALRSGATTTPGKSMFFYTDDGNSEAYRITSTGTSIWYPGFSEGMRLTSTGLGIGTSSPSEKLAINGRMIALATGSGYTANPAGGVFGYYSAGTPTTYVQAPASGQIQFWGPSTAAWATLDSSGNLGIGTSSPSEKLHVQKAAGAYVLTESTTATNSGYRLKNTQRDWYLLNDSNGRFALYDDTAAATRLQVDASGNLGLGVTPSAWSGVKAIQISSATFASTGIDSYLFANSFYNGSSDRYIGNGYASYYAQSAGKHLWYTAPSGTAGNAISFTQAMTLDASGNLGVGQTSPGARLNVDSGSTGLMSIFNSTNANGGYITGQSSGSAIWDFGTAKQVVNTGGASDVALSSRSGFLAFGTGSSERARIDSSGNLLVAKTTTADTTVGAAMLSSGRVTSSMASSTSSESTLHVYSTGASAYRFYVDLAGTIYATSTTITAISDQRLKENIQDLDVGLDKIMALKPRKFDWKPGKGKDKKGDRGWIAQEFEQVFPDMVTTWLDPAPEGEEPYKAVNADLIPVLVKALQEMKQIVDAQAAEIAALKGK